MKLLPISYYAGNHTFSNPGINVGIRSYYSPDSNANNVKFAQQEQKNKNPDIAMLSTEAIYASVVNRNNGTWYNVTCSIAEKHFLLFDIQHKVNNHQVFPTRCMLVLRMNSEAPHYKLHIDPGKHSSMNVKNLLIEGRFDIINKTLSKSSGLLTNHDKFKDTYFDPTDSNYNFIKIEEVSPAINKLKKRIILKKKILANGSVIAIKKQRTRNIG